MRNPLKRLARTDQPKPTLQARLAGAKGKLVAVKEKYGRTLRVHRALNVPIEKPEPVDRAALVNYATFLALERDHVCAELYPHMGMKASRFVLSMNEAWAFYRSSHNGLFERKDLAPASSRALKVLDLVGIDWRKNANESDHRFFDDAGRADTGERPALPFGWPALDADLTEALDDLTRLDAAMEGLHSGNPHRDGDTVPGYDALADAREDTLDRLAETRAQGLPGLQAKAHALLMPSVHGISNEIDKLAESLARDVIGARPSVLDQLRPDPIFAAIEETKRLFEAWKEAGKLPLPAGDIDPSQETVDAMHAFNTHVADVLLATVPTTAAGCAALARYAVEFARREQFALDDDRGHGQAHLNILDLIARSPMRA